MAEQRFVKTNAPGLNVGEMFKTLVLHTVAGMMAQPGGDRGHLAAIMTEVANMTTPVAGYDRDNPAANKDVGKHVEEYLAYRFHDGDEPKWHEKLMEGQDSEEDFKRTQEERG